MVSGSPSSGRLSIPELKQLSELSPVGGDGSPHQHSTETWEKVLVTIKKPHQHSTGRQLPESWVHEKVTIKS